MQCPECQSPIETIGDAAPATCPRCNASLAPRPKSRSRISLLSIILLLLVVGLATIAVGSTIVAKRAIEQRDRARQDFALASRGFDQLVEVTATNTKPPKKELLQPALDYYQKFVETHATDKGMLSELASARFHMAALHAKLGSKDGVARMSEGLMSLDELIQDENADPATIPSLQDAALKVATPVEWFMVKGADQQYGTALVFAITRALGSYDKLSQRHPKVISFRDNHSALLKGFAMLQGQLPNGRQRSLDNWLKARDVLETLVRDEPANTDFQTRLVESLVTVARMQKSDKEIDKAAANLQRAVEIREQMAAANPDDKALQRELTTVKRDLEKLQSADAAGSAASADKAATPAADKDASAVTTEPAVAEKDTPAADQAPPAGNDATADKTP